MEFNTTLLIGFFVGAIVMWIFDWFFYGRSSSQEELEHAHHELSATKAAHASMNSELDTAKNSLTATSNDLVQARADGKECAAALDAANARIAELEAAAKKPAPAPAKKKSAKDDLKQVNGIGPVYEKKLNAAGIMTFAELAATDPQRVHAIIEPKDWQNLETEEWVQEAAKFAAE